ncbi:MAG: MarR family winged helix-turn-helix transcriptional regulator [Sphingobium sp.]
MENNIAFLCVDIGRLFRKRFADAARCVGGTGAQWRALIVLRRMPGISQGTLAERLDVEPITACRMVDRLEQAGLVERRRDPADRRAWRLFLTDAADPVVDELEDIGARMLEQATSVLDEDEKERVRRGLSAIRDTLAATDEQPCVREVSNG